MLLKPRSPRSFRNYNNKCFLVFFKTILLTYIAEIYLIINYYLTMFHICRTIGRHFSLRQVKLYIGQRKYKQKLTAQGGIESRSLT